MTEMSEMVSLKMGVQSGTSRTTGKQLLQASLLIMSLVIFKVKCTFYSKSRDTECNF